MKKRGALELSVSTIVIVVIGVTLLTLGLLFVTSIFTDIGGQQKQLTAFSDEKIREIFEGSEDYINIPATRIKIKIGETETIDILIKNVGDSTIANPSLEWNIAIAAVPNAMVNRKSEIGGWFRSPGMTGGGTTRLISEFRTLEPSFDKKLRYDITPIKGKAVSGTYTIPVELKSGTRVVAEDFLTIELR